MRLAPLHVTALVLAASVAGAAAADKPVTSGLQPTRQYTVQGAFRTDDGDVATDISGLACMPAASGRRVCLVINDEDRSAQFATLADASLTAGTRLPLLGKHPSTATLGKAPTNTHCSSGEAGFKDLDGEGVAYAAPFFYLVGSHGCSRHGAKFRASAFITARIRVDGNGNVVNPDGTAPGSEGIGTAQVQTTYRLSEALAKAGEFGAFFGKDLNGASGLNVEGVAVVGGRLFAGLRAPSIGDRAAIVGVAVEDLFAQGETASKGETRIVPVKVGSDLGIRDLAPLADGRLLVLSGPAQEQDLPYGLHLVDPQAPSSSTFLATFEDVMEQGKRAKAEALLVLGQEAEALTILLMFDGPPNGGPREYRVPLK